MLERSGNLCAVSQQVAGAWAAGKGGLREEIGSQSHSVASNIQGGPG